VPLSVLHDRRSMWLVPASYLWVLPALLLGPPRATALTLVLPVVLLVALSRHEASSAPDPTQPSGPLVAAETSVIQACEWTVTRTAGPCGGENGPSAGPSGDLLSGRMVRDPTSSLESNPAQLLRRSPGKRPS
jgi:hypothetical protein